MKTDVWAKRRNYRNTADEERPSFSSSSSTVGKDYESLKAKAWAAHRQVVREENKDGKKEEVTSPVASSPAAKSPIQVQRKNSSASSTCSHASNSSFRSCKSSSSAKNIAIWASRRHYQVEKEAKKEEEKKESNSGVAHQAKETVKQTMTGCASAGMGLLNIVNGVSFFEMLPSIFESDDTDGIEP